MNDRNKSESRNKRHKSRFPLGRIEREKRTVEAMVRIYCSDQHATSDEICENCTRLLTYARSRLDTCPFQANKPTCNHCKVHCYSKTRQHEIQKVMRYSGPRMLFRYPLLSLWHLIDTIRKVPSLEKGSDRNN
ncbi:MAG: nitrous oxide-stimulated promoter family protein [Gammaproteobacteria bacterium]